MAEAIEKANLLFTTGYFMRTHPKHLFLKEQIAKGSFGKITRIRGSNCHSGSLGGWFDTEWRWMADPKIAGVGAFGDLGTHSLDILMWLLGDVDAVTARHQSGDGPLRRLRRNRRGADAVQERRHRHAGRRLGGRGQSGHLLISGTEGHAVIVDNFLYFRSKKCRARTAKTHERSCRGAAAADEPVRRMRSRD